MKKKEQLRELKISFCETSEIINTVKPVNKGHPRERHNIVFIDKWSLFEGFFVLFYQGRLIEV